MRSLKNASTATSFAALYIAVNAPPRAPHLLANATLGKRDHQSVQVP